MSIKARLSACAALAALLPAAPAFAETETQAAPRAETRDVITVTTQFRAQSLADVPINVTAFDAELIDRLDIRNLEDLALFTPGLVILEQSPNNTGYSLRGITTDSGAANAEARVALFQDGVSITRSRASYVELFDIERLEVAKGPQPTLFGRGALIGGINIIQNKAVQENSASLFGGFGNYNQRELGGHVNHALGENYAFRLAGVLRARDGHIENLGDGKDLQGRHVAGVRAVFSGAPTDTFSFHVIANWQEDSGPGTSFKSGILAAPGTDTSPYTAADLRLIPGFLDGQQLGLNRTVQGVTVLTDWDLSDALHLSTITGYRDYDSLEVFDPIGAGLNFVNFAEDASGRQTSHEMRLTFDDGGPLTAFGGFTYFYEANTQRVPGIFNEGVAQAFFVSTGAFGDPAAVAAALGVPVSAITDLRNPFPFSIAALSSGQGMVPLRANYTEESANAGRTEAWDVFADVSYAVTDRLTLTAGVRYTNEDKVASGYGGTSMGPNRVTFGPMLVLPATPNGAEVSQTASFDAWTWRFVAAYELNDRINTWASFARGRRPDVIALDTTSPDFFSIAPAEIVESLEAGAFISFDRGNVSGSVFRSEYENFQSAVFDPTSGTFAPDNAGNATQYGMELQTDWRVHDRVDVFATYTYNLATFDSTSGGQPQQFAGNRFRYSPEHSVALGARIQVADGPWGEVSLLPSYSWQSHFYFDNDNQEFDGVRQDSYGVLRARLRYETADRNRFAELFGNNLTDEQYLIDAGNTGAAFGLPTFIAAAPRTFGIRVGAYF
ncbi:TonB-dependent receptor [Alkalicaulis satelles]|uniref:TonB-dependent receptor n=1 Tax=Alkalicaulis satelles TaxID=2609175 RepID=A0A5M6ZIU5_9PROT|nr:TonB-dependent receptor [Alkalicaulis satelles]KAA5803684.1 TonB-dependent receptor [Alkalicaulis satelles]